MDVVIFCGGRGTRLSEKTKDLPKPLVEVGDNPIIWHIMKTFDHFGHKRFILPLGYKGDLLKQWFLNYKYNQSFEIDYNNNQYPSPVCDWKVNLSDTGLDSGTGYRLKKVKDQINTNTFIVTYGDGVADIDIDTLLGFHEKMKLEKGVIATMSAFRPTSKFGIIDHTNDGLIKGFMEKPVINEWANMGFIVCEKEIFDYLPNNPDSMFEKDTLPQLAKEGKLAIFKHNGFFQPMDTFKDYIELNQLWDSKNARWKVWKN